ncbi:hypothetical protein ACLMJK_004527 [Lecanora helva]
MLPLPTILMALSITTLTQLTTAQTLTPDATIPDGYQVGMATQDYEPDGQQSICTTNCQLAHPFPDTAGPKPLPDGVFAAAINPALGGGPTDCGPCGSCYSIISAGEPYCQPDPYDPNCGAPSGPVQQTGPKEIKVLITNHCPDCDNVPGHFDINQAPTGWNNPRIYWKRLDDMECL